MAPGTGPLASAGIHVSADDYYAAENWDVAKYWQRQAQAWGAPPPRGNVHVGGLVPLDPGSAGPEPPSDDPGRSEERRVGQESDSTCRFRWSTCTYTNKEKKHEQEKQ